MIETPSIVQTTARHMATIHLTLSMSEMQSSYAQCVGELIGAIQAQGIEPVGSVFDHYLKITPDTFDFDMCMQVKTPVAAAGRVRPDIWPAMHVARTVHHGAYEGLPGAWGEFMAWCEAEGHATASDLWQSYTVGPHANPDPQTWRTELCRQLLAPAGKTQ